MYAYKERDMSLFNLQWVYKALLKPEPLIYISKDFAFERVGPRNWDIRSYFNTRSVEIIQIQSQTMTNMYDYACQIKYFCVFLVLLCIVVTIGDIMWMNILSVYFVILIWETK